MWVVAQMGARMNYAIPRILHQVGLLQRLYTDFAAPKWACHIRGKWVPAGFRRAQGRVPTDVPRELIQAFPVLGTAYALRRRFAQSPRAASATHLWAAKRFCEAVVEGGLGTANAVYTFDRAGLEILQHARAAGVFAVMEQTVAPVPIVAEHVKHEYDTFPRWENPVSGNQDLGELVNRERKEWENAALILCGSEFVKQGIRACGGPIEKCVVVPYGVGTVRSVTPVLRYNHRRKLRVLTVGTVNLRKGAPYVLVAARRLRDVAEFRMVGAIAVTEVARRALAEHIDLIGPVDRSEVAKQYQWADVFLLPSVCEGSATVCYEALGAGLPVITTPNAGSVVQDGLEGFIVPVRNPDEVVDRLGRLASEPELLATMSQRAFLRAQDFTIDRYADRLLTALNVA